MGRKISISVGGALVGVTVGVGTASVCPCGSTLAETVGLLGNK